MNAKDTQKKRKYRLRKSILERYSDTGREREREGERKVRVRCKNNDYDRENVCDLEGERKNARKQTRV